MYMYCKCIHNPCINICEFLNYLITGEDNHNFVPLQEVIVHKINNYHKEIQYYGL